MLHKINVEAQFWCGQSGGTTKHFMFNSSNGILLKHFQP